MLIYCIENTVNNKCYIGQTTHSLLERKSHHLYELKSDVHPNNYIQNSWNKYGEENFKFFILEKGFDTIEELNNAEQFWIQYLQTMYYQDGYNIKRGGKNSRQPKLIKEKISKANTKYKNIGVYSEKGKLLTKHKTIHDVHKKYNIEKYYIRSVLSGINKSSHGYIFREIKYNNPQQNIKEYRYRNKHYVGKYNLDGKLLKIFTDVHSVDLKDYKTCTLRSACSKSIKSYKGYLWRSDENKNNIPNKIPKYNINHHECKKVNQYNLKGEYLNTYNSLIEAAKAIGFDYGNSIGLCCKGENKSCGGYQWKFWKKDYPKKIEPYTIIKPKNGARRVKKLTKDGELIQIYESMEDARKDVGLKTSTPISECCRGNYNTSAGYKWEYV